uniref:Uncharacterized protein n=1 Tax=Rhizophora mucronata TaxID=61149 RepID=A0A2P2NUN1_RHIMU
MVINNFISTSSWMSQNKYIFSSVCYFLVCCSTAFFFWFYSVLYSLSTSPSF